MTKCMSKKGMFLCVFNVMMSSCVQGECRLQMEAQRLSLSQIHAAQIELQQEDSEHRTHTLELKLQNLRDNGEGEQTCRRSLLCVFVARQCF